MKSNVKPEPIIMSVSMCALKNGRPGGKKAVPKANCTSTLFASERKYFCSEVNFFNIVEDNDVEKNWQFRNINRSNDADAS